MQPSIEDMQSLIPEGEESPSLTQLTTALEDSVDGEVRVQIGEDLTDPEGAPIYEYDEEGNPELDEEGNPIILTNDAVIPCIGAVKAGEMPQTSNNDGEPYAVGVPGWGDKVKEEIKNAENKASAAEVASTEAKKIVEAVNQAVWKDDDGIHVSTDTKEAEGEVVGDPDGTHNSIFNSLGILFRKLKNNLVSISQSAVAFYDGEGNEAENVTATFGSNGATIGKTSGLHSILASAFFVIKNGANTLASFGQNILLGRLYDDDGTPLNNIFISAVGGLSFRVGNTVRSIFDATQARIGTAAGNNVKATDSEVTINTGNTVNAKFTANKVALGINGETAEIDFCNGKGKIKKGSYWDTSDQLGIESNYMAIDAKSAAIMRQKYYPGATTGTWYSSSVQTYMAQATSTAAALMAKRGTSPTAETQVAGIQAFASNVGSSVLISGKSITAEVAITILSDKRKKKKIKPLGEEYEELHDLLNPVSFQYRDGDSGRLHTGFIAQELKQAIEEAGLTTDSLAALCEIDDYDKCGNPVFDKDGNQKRVLAIRYEEMIALNTKVIQTQKKRIDALEAAIAELTAKVESLV